MSDTGGFAGIEGRHLYLCTPDRPDIEQFLDACLAGGVDIVQLRDKHLEAGALVDRGRLARRVCAAHGVPCIMNDRPDLALDAGMDGVHVGQDDASPALARSILGSDALVGLSTHAPAELDESTTAPVDYVSAGPVAPTPTKPGRPGTGPAYVTYATERAAHPVFVTGGVTPDTVPALAAAGALGFVVVRYLVDSDDPGRDARRLRRAVDQAIDRLRAGA